MSLGVQHIRVHGNFSFIFDKESAGGEYFPKSSLAERRKHFVARQKKLSHGPYGRMFFQDRPLAEKEVMGQRKKDAGSIAAFAVATAAMCHAGHGGEGHGDHVMPRNSIKMRCEAYTTGIMFTMSLEKSVHIHSEGWRSECEGPRNDSMADRPGAAGENGDRGKTGAIFLRSFNGY